MIIRRIFFSAILAGLITGVGLTALQWLGPIPLLLEAETYEQAGSGHGGHDHGAADTQHTHDHDHGVAAGAAEAWAPADGLERTVFTMLANVVLAVGFALLLTAGYAAVGQVDWRRGIWWGAAGFAVFQLAPALGLPPELPGSPSAGFEARQLWWLLTVVLTATGLGAAVFAGSWFFKGLGLIIIALPHLIGAPHSVAEPSALPIELATRFVVISMMTNAAFWLVLGGLSGFLFGRDADLAAEDGDAAEAA